MKAEAHHITEEYLADAIEQLMAEAAGGKR
jgi:hypothetical protein